MPVFELDENLWFPNPYFGEDDIIAVGGDLSPERLILAYSNGIFPWFSFRDDESPVWYCPLDRFVIFPGEIHISHSMRTLLNKGKYEFTFNEAFESVIKECASVEDRINQEGAWLGKDMVKAYTRMHRLGLAKSVEVWEIPERSEKSGDRGNSGSSCIPCLNEKKLVGGLYGIQMKNAFFGESMFSRVPSGSKLALIYLAHIALETGWHFIDCQFETPHLQSMGGRHIPYHEYMDLLNTEI